MLRQPAKLHQLARIKLPVDPVSGRFYDRFG